METGSAVHQQTAQHRIRLELGSDTPGPYLPLPPTPQAYTEPPARPPPPPTLSCLWLLEWVTDWSGSVDLLTDGTDVEDGCVLSLRLHVLDSTAMFLWFHSVCFQVFLFCVVRVLGYILWNWSGFVVVVLWICLCEVGLCTVGGIAEVGTFTERVHYSGSEATALRTLSYRVKFGICYFFSFFHFFWDFILMYRYMIQKCVCMGVCVWMGVCVDGCVGVWVWVGVGGCCQKVWL